MIRVGVSDAQTGLPTNGDAAATTPAGGAPSRSPSLAPKLPALQGGANNPLRHIFPDLLLTTMYRPDTLSRLSCGRSVNNNEQRIAGKLTRLIWRWAENPLALWRTRARHGGSVCLLARARSVTWGGSNAIHRSTLVHELTTETVAKLTVENSWVGKHYGRNLQASRYGVCRFGVAVSATHCSAAVTCCRA
jgi:hypothetical protein